jgi:hypothetical protein
MYQSSQKEAGMQFGNWTQYGMSASISGFVFNISPNRNTHLLLTEPNNVISAFHDVLWFNHNHADHRKHRFNMSSVVGSWFVGVGTYSFAIIT